MVVVGAMCAQAKEPKMITPKQAKAMSTEALHYTANDLSEVIQVQEKSVREGGHCPKLGQYHDDRAVVYAEQKRRVGTREIKMSFEVQGIDTPSETQARAKQMVVEALRLYRATVDAEKPNGWGDDLDLIDAMLRE